MNLKQVIPIGSNFYVVISSSNSRIFNSHSFVIGGFNGETLIICDYKTDRKQITQVLVTLLNSLDSCFDKDCTNERAPR